MSKWISPGAAMDMVFDDPARTGPSSDFGFAILWATDGKGGAHRAADLARAKLQPCKPAAHAAAPGTAGWATTAHDHRLVLAHGVPDMSAREMVEGYDVADAGQNLLAVVQTLQFDADLPRHAMMHMAYMYTAMCLQPKRLSSLIVQHMPGDARSIRAPHVHVLTLTRTHRISGFGEVHAVFDDAPADMHRAFEADWHRVRDALVRIGA